jgi:hypothetical protein
MVIIRGVHRVFRVELSIRRYPDCVSIALGSVSHATSGKFKLTQYPLLTSVDLFDKQGERLMKSAILVLLLAVIGSTNSLRYKSEQLRQRFFYRFHSYDLHPQQAFQA